MRIEESSYQGSPMLVFYKTLDDDRPFKCGKKKLRAALDNFTEVMEHAEGEEAGITDKKAFYSPGSKYPIEITPQQAGMIVENEAIIKAFIDKPESEHPKDGVAATDPADFPKVTSVRVNLWHNNNILGFATVTLGNLVEINSIKILTGANGMFIGMPSVKKGEEWKDQVKPCSKTAYEYLRTAVLDKYDEVSAAAEGGE